MRGDRVGVGICCSVGIGKFINGCFEIFSIARGSAVSECFTNLSTIICFTFSSSTQEGHLIRIDEDGGAREGARVEPALSPWTPR